MLISDHICMAPSPLIGENANELGVRFPDMSNIYDRELRDIVRNTAKELDIPLREGVYIQLAVKIHLTKLFVRSAFFGNGVIHISNRAFCLSRR